MLNCHHTNNSGFALCVVSLGCGVSLGLFDKRAARLTSREEKGSGLYTVQHIACVDTACSAKTSLSEMVN